MIRDGVSDVAIVASGSILGACITASDILAEQGQSVPIYSLPLLAPWTSGFLDILTTYRVLIAVSEHSAIGGFASALREALSNTDIKVVGIEIKELLTDQVGNQEQLRIKCGLGIDVILKKVREAIGG
jgi:transketolase C-terminal domain/subunit